MLLFVFFPLLYFILQKPLSWKQKTKLQKCSRLKAVILVSFLVLWFLQQDLLLLFFLQFSGKHPYFRPLIFLREWIDFYTVLTWTRFRAPLYGALLLSYLWWILIRTYKSATQRCLIAFQKPGSKNYQTLILKTMQPFECF